MNTEATLRIMDRAHKEMGALPRAEQGTVYEFMNRFRANPRDPMLYLQVTATDVRTARIDGTYRALLLPVGPRDYLLVAVKHRDEVADTLARYDFQVNPVTGGIEVIDVRPVPVSTGGQPPIFAAFTDAQLLALGVAEPLLAQIRAVSGESELLALTATAPQLTADVLVALADGTPYQEVLEQITEPVRAEAPVDPHDLTAAVNNPATQVFSDDEALQAVLGETFEQWQVFLHPTQRKLAEKPTTGPTRVGGGPGTGKTIVALHRVAHLVRRLPPGKDKPILLTTFNRNLAADLRTRLIALGGQELTARVDIVNIDKLASRVVSEAKAGTGKRIIDDNKVVGLWQTFLLETGEKDWDADFLCAEWTQIILGQVLNSRADYFRARRPNRGRSLTRGERDQVWQLTERFVNWLDGQGVWTWRQVAERAARLEMDRAARAATAAEESSGSLLRHRYRHVVVDEAQDLSAAHWKMLRAMVPAVPDDMFLAGDTHQRIYDNHVTLGSLGINIRGRSSRLTLSYRTTRQILAAALEIMSGEVYDDLDGGEENLAGYRSLLRGERPTFRGAATWAQEQDLIADQVKAWGSPADGSIAVCVPTRELAAQVTVRLEREGMAVIEIGPDGPKTGGGVHVGTMHRFKGLEYQRMIIAGVSDGLVPRQMIGQFQLTDPKRYERERQRDRSLLFVAATRARDELAVFWHGTPSSFLTTRLTQQ
ncbi:UvrD-helicase domain-containing protein [Actinoplanes couchii]|uniref:DNA 3'-5' helicase n=1 Tax=Actinoplanes couchii TaxID=403638 RepID=A0ABQ3WZE5_9ACTN|nr:UvrD-helicase domain-containing protein [Actinoplanes couchii]MDR6316040.1 superfamily I DNA/RNA helicase [Actinoplanes couchii]GID51654.1 DNA helicase [Actinoplanes couchii]